MVEHLRTADALELVVSALPGGGEARSGQVAMAEAVHEAIERERHVVVQAGTGIGKSLGYLVPALRAGRRVVVATATKALQDQLATKDLPFLAEHLDTAFTWAVLKGRSNYLCLQRLREAQAARDGHLELEELTPTVEGEVQRLAAWAATTVTGDRTALPWAPSEAAWEAVSVSADQCPGASRCPLGEPCFAERARRQASEADLVVVNTHLYGLDVATGGVLLPEHDVVVVDEAHALEDIISDTAGCAIGPGRFAGLARVLRRLLTATDLPARLEGAGDRLGAVLAPEHGRRLPAPLPVPVADALVACRAAVDEVLTSLRAIRTDHADADQRRVRAQKWAGTLADDVDTVLGMPEGLVAWVGGPAGAPRLEVAPIDVGPVLADGVWSRRTAVLTSATIPLNLPDRVGLAPGSFDAIDVGSPFDYEANALLYCAAHLPDPRRGDRAARVHDELAHLITAAGGRTLALFTSWRALRAAVDDLRDRLPFPVLAQDDLPKPALLAAFAADEATCLFATGGLFQGIDVPGPTLSLVAIDRLPFPRPDDPLLSARRDRAGSAAFRTVDLPRAATLLAQAAGRLVRTATDRGVVAVLDPRLATAGYRWDVVAALPPMRRTRHRDEVAAFLGAIAAERDQAASGTSR